MKPGLSVLLWRKCHFRIAGPNGLHLCFGYPVLGPKVSSGGFLQPSENPDKVLGEMCRETVKAMAALHKLGICHGGELCAVGLSVSRYGLGPAPQHLASLRPAQQPLPPGHWCKMICPQGSMDPLAREDKKVGHCPEKEDIISPSPTLPRSSLPSLSSPDAPSWSPSRGLCLEMALDCQYGIRE